MFIARDEYSDRGCRSSDYKRGTYTKLGRNEQYFSNRLCARLVRFNPENAHLETTLIRVRENPGRSNI